MSTSQKRYLERQIAELRAHSAAAYKARVRLEQILANYDKVPPEPTEKMLSVYVLLLPDRSDLNSMVPIVRHGDIWYAFIPGKEEPDQFSWEELCSFLHASVHNGLVIAKGSANNTVLPSNIA